MLTLLPVVGVDEVTAGADLAALLGDAITLADGDVLVVTSKVVSKAEGRVTTADPAAALAEETDRVVARRGPTSIVRTTTGLVMANAGIDASNTPAGTLVLLPVDPDASARGLRERIATRQGVNVAVVVTDTFGRAWRAGQTDVAIGVAGLAPMHDYAGRSDDHGNELAVTAPAVADEIAGAGDLVKGKVRRVPAAVLRGLGGLVLAPGEHGPGARALVRDEAEDMFGLGARDAVVQAAAASTTRGFGRPAGAEDVARVLGGQVVAADCVEVVVPVVSDRELGRQEALLGVVAFAHGWRRTDPETRGEGRTSVTALRFLPIAP